MNASPELGFSRPVIIFIVVVFPAPFGPRNPNISPFSTERFTLETAVKSPKDFVRFVVFKSVFVFNYVFPFFDSGNDYENSSRVRYYEGTMTKQQISSVSLPVLSEKARFIEAVSKGANVVFTASTGSGKSTCLPRWLYEALNGRVLVIEPRRVACKSLATFVANQMGEKVGETVGYRIRFDDCSSVNTKILYVTPGVAVKMLQTLITDYAAIVVDEFHERPWESDLVVAYLRREQNSSSDIFLKTLVITSATVEGKVLASRLDAMLIQGKGSLHKVHISYDEGAMAPTSMDLPERVLQAVKKRLQ